MKNLVKTLVVAGAMVTAGTAVADFGDVKFSLGADYLQAWMKGSNANGQNFGEILPKSFPGATVYVGARIMENFGLEAGYDWSAKKKKNWTDTDGDNFTTKISKKGAHLDLVGFLPVSDCADVFASLGWGWVKPKLTVTDNTPGNPAGNNPVKVKGKSILRLGVGASYLFTDMFGVRAKLGWEGTKALRIKEEDGTSHKAFKDSVTAALGVFAKF